MYYDIYREIRESSWQCLIDHGITELPVDIMKIARAVGIHVKRDSRVNYLLPGEKGKLLMYGNECILIYNDRNPIELSRFTIAHELGHFILGHHKIYEKYKDIRDISKKPKAEQQADMFALRLLCPACVLWGLELRTAEEIARICRVEMSVAAERAERMKQLYERNSFLSSPCERRLYESFAPFIERVRLEKTAYSADI